MAKKTPFLAQLPRPLPCHRWSLRCPSHGNSELPKGWARSEAEEQVCHGGISRGLAKHLLCAGLRAVEGGIQSGWAVAHAVQELTAQHGCQCT